MANNTSDDELRQALMDIYVDSSILTASDVLNEMMSVIKRREEQVAREARIDELEMLEGLKGKVYMHGAVLDQSQLGDTNDQRIDYRIVELRLSTLTGAKEIDKLTTTHKGDQ